MKPAAALFVLALASAVSGVSEEHWWPAVAGSVQSIVSGQGERPSLYVLTREAKNDDDSDAERRWSIQRWDPSSPESLTPLIDIPATKLRPRLNLIKTTPTPSLGLVIGSDLWLLPLDEIESGAQRPLGRPSFTDPSPEGRLLRIDPRAPRAYAAGIGEAEIFDLSTSRSVRVRLPTDVRPRKTGLQLQSPPLRAIGDQALYIAGPQSLADLRLRTIFVDAGWEQSDSQEPEPREAWSLLPGPERLEDSRYEWIDGRPFLFCVTLRADKQGFFEKKKVRIFELRPDRTRAGSAPHFERLTSSRMWQPLGMHLVDVDRDSTRDLVLLQPEGFSGKKLIVDVFRGLSGGQFDDRALRTVIPELDGDQPHLYGADWTGDDIPDLVALQSHTITIFAGLETLKKKSVIEREPSRTIEIGSLQTTPTRLERHGTWLVAYGSGSSALVVIDPAAAGGRRP